MGVVGVDFPDRLAARGCHVSVFGDWSTRGDSCDQQCIALHHTASGRSSSSGNNAAYAHDNRHYNVMIGRDRIVYVIMRNKSNDSGETNRTSVDEACAGRASSTSAVQLGRSDNYTGANSRTFAIAYDNDGVGEPWPDDFVRLGATVAAVALGDLGLAHAGYVTQHRVLTSRKIDNCGDACPHDFQPFVTDALGGGGGPGPAAGSLLELGLMLIFGPSGAALVGAGYWQNLGAESYGYWSSVPGIVQQNVDQRGWDVMRADALYGAGANPRGESG